MVFARIAEQLCGELPRPAAGDDARDGDINGAVAGAASGNGSAEFAALVDLSKTLARDGVGEAPEAYARVNAIAARLYGLTGDQFQYVAGTFPLIDRRVRSRAFELFASPDRAPFCRLE